MMRRTFGLLLVTVVAGALASPVAARAQTTTNDKPAVAIPAGELTAEVPELDALHEVVYQLWHEAYPARDYAKIKDLLPQTDDLTAKLDAAALPGILRDKQAQWDAGKVELKASLALLHSVADANDEEGMLKETEAYHAAFEGLVRTIRPVTPELDAFHQELYKLYHYSAPAYDIAAIRTQAKAMQDRIPALAESTLPKRVADRQDAFAAAVSSLSTEVDNLVKTAEKDDKDAVLAAVEKVHTAYVKTEKVFN
ncbi:MAG TPA: hypothetical protein VFX92_10290 [Candidatus Krumholzibacteria bacterium]|nr:hypothetical protein [Candidatus Krumholzibacteria bacterium]